MTADLRDPEGAIRQVAFGTTGTLLRAPVPPGRWELEALELDEPTGVAITNGHQNGENPAAATQSQTHVALGPLLALPAHGPSLLRVPLGAWRGVGAATTAPVRSGAAAMVDFAMTGMPGVLRPAQPTDTQPVPVLADPQTAASAGPGGRIALTVDGLPVIARVVGVLSRFPTLPADSAGFVIADEPTLAAALDAQLPGQGRPDELWIGTAHLAGLRAALGSGALAQLDSSFRVDIDHQLRDAPVARGVLGTLIAATALSAVLAVVGLLAALLGGVRDERVESDLTEQGVGPRGLRAELRVRLALASLLGVVRRRRDRGAADATGGRERSRRGCCRRSEPAGGDGRSVGGAGRLERWHVRGARAGRMAGAAGERGPMSEAVVELRDVFCVHRTNEGDAAALAGTNLELARGEVLCVLGPSGAGKSTLLRVVAGIQPPSAGVVRVLGRDIGRMPARSRSRLRHELVGFLGQHTETALSPDLRMRDAVGLPLALRGVPRRERRTRVDELLEATALADRADALPGELSGGERQRFALCAALAHRPALLLADEPTGELDDASADATRALIVELARTNGTSVILVTHDPATAEVADRTLRIRDGRIVGDRRGGQEALVIDGGWLRLPADLLTQAGIGRRARVRPTPDGVIVTPADSDSGPASPAGPAGPAAAEARPQPPAPWAPVQVGLRSVARTYGHGPTRRDVLGGLTHDFAPGRMTAITGRSGAGKTTLLKLVAGLDRPSSGQVMLDGQPLGDRDGEQLASLRRERIGYLSQEPAPIGFLSAEENAVLVLRIRGWDADAAAERAASGADPSRARRPRPPARPPALGRGSPAPGAGPGARECARAADRRRADLTAGRAQRPSRRGPAGRRRARGGPDRDLRHPRPRRDQPGRPRRRPGRIAKSGNGGRRRRVQRRPRTCRRSATQGRGIRPGPRTPYQPHPSRPPRSANLGGSAWLA